MNGLQESQKSMSVQNVIVHTGTEKKCTKCGINKQLNEFYIRNKKRGIYRTECKSCGLEQKKNYYKSNAGLLWKEKNHDKRLEHSRKWRSRNPDNIKEWAKKNPEKIAEYQRKRKLKREKERTPKQKKGKVLKCPLCGKGFYRMPSKIKQSVYCSVKCRAEAAKKDKPHFLCKMCGKEYCRQASQVKWRGTGFCSGKCQNKWASIYRVGEKSPTWKGGVSSKSHRIRTSAKWREWRELVFKRDNWECQICGAKSMAGKPVFLHPHHIKFFSLFPKYRFDVNNGKTVCVDCHKKIHREYNFKAKQRKKCEKVQLSLAGMCEPMCKSS